MKPYDGKAPPPPSPPFEAAAIAAQGREDRAASGNAPLNGNIAIFRFPRFDKAAGLLENRRPLRRSWPIRRRHSTACIDMIEEWRVSGVLASTPEASLPRLGPGNHLSTAGQARGGEE